ncbi:MAG: GTP-binding protein HflX [Neolewinella sp.]
MHQAILRFFQKDLIESEIFLPWPAQEMRSKIFSACDVLNERANDAGAFFRFRATPDMIATMNKLSGDACRGEINTL